LPLLRAQDNKQISEKVGIECLVWDLGYEKVTIKWVKCYQVVAFVVLLSINDKAFCQNRDARAISPVLLILPASS
jgi:hypothetical protein